MKDIADVSAYSVSSGRDMIAVVSQSFPSDIFCALLRDRVYGLSLRVVQPVEKVSG